MSARQTAVSRARQMILASALCLGSPLALALSPDPELVGLHQPDPAAAAQAEAAWSGEAELGGNRSSGNANNANLNAKIQLAHQNGTWAQHLRLESQQASQNGITTANHSMAEWETTHALGDEQYSFGVARASHDPFAGYAYQASLSAGLGHVFRNTQGSRLTLEAGPGVRQSQQTSGARQTEVIGRVAGHLSVPLTPQAKFTQQVTTLAGASNTELESETGLSTSLTDHIGLKLSYTILHNSATLADKKPTDTLTAFSLQYHFK
ncbi:YdiY family protein [Halothiobacillus sp. DCM-1]|uniref:DUF481 domain-containing protein n=1 Tax=Halothiobacillus sp. DCM-1 TaxID=3112558 RepID=UPI00324BE6CC